MSGTASGAEASPADLAPGERAVLLACCDELLAMLAPDGWVRPAAAQRMGRILSAALLGRGSSTDLRMGGAALAAMGFTPGDVKALDISGRLMSLAPSSRSPTTRAMWESRRSRLQKLREDGTIDRIGRLRAHLLREGALTPGFADAPPPGGLPRIRVRRRPDAGGAGGDRSPGGRLRIRMRMRPAPPITGMGDGPSMGCRGSLSGGGVTDLIRLERASQTHEDTLQVLRHYLVGCGVACMESPLLDLACRLGGVGNIFEVKSIAEGNERDQVRAAFAQLHDYAFVYRGHELLAGGDPRLWVVLSEAPRDAWTEGFLTHHGIRLLWVEDGGLVGTGLGEFEGA